MFDNEMDAYSVELFQPIDHPDASGEDVLQFTVDLTATKNGVPVSTQLVVTVEDDSPNGDVSVHLNRMDATVVAGSPELMTFSGQLIGATGEDSDTGQPATVVLGADGGYIRYIALHGGNFWYDGEANTLTVTGSQYAYSYNFDPLTHELTVTSLEVAGATATVNMLTGVYTAQMPAGGWQTANFAVKDNDGDEAWHVLELYYAPVITGVESGVPGVGDDAVMEGQSLVYTVTLNGAPDLDTTYTFSLGGGSATAGSDYTNAPVFSNGVINNGDGTITVPFGVSSFTVTVPTIDDVVIEAGPNETLPLMVGGVTGVGQIIDNESVILATVSEEGLANGAPDTVGEPIDTTNLATFSGALSVDLSAVTGPAGLTSGGVAVTWTVVTSGGVRTLTGSAGGVKVVEAVFNNTADSYSVTLLKPLDHPAGNGENLLNFDIGLTTASGGALKLQVTVEDDAPSSDTLLQNQVISGGDANVMIIFDLSGSMSDADGRFENAKLAAQNLLDTYEASGETRVRLVTFSDTGTAVGSEWQSVANAKAYLAGLTTANALGGTNYDGAIAVAMTAFKDAGRLATAPNYS